MLYLCVQTGVWAVGGRRAPPPRKSCDVFTVSSVQIRAQSCREPGEGRWSTRRVTRLGLTTPVWLAVPSPTTHTGGAAGTLTRNSLRAKSLSFSYSMSQGEFGIIKEAEEESDTRDKSGDTRTSSPQHQPAPPGFNKERRRSSFSLAKLGKTSGPWRNIKYFYK